MRTYPSILGPILGTIAFLAATLSGCDVVTPPIIKKGTTGNDTCVAVNYQYSTQKKVLLEDYTGFVCGNCPEASVVGDQLKLVYGDRLVIMKVHAGQLAEPDAQHKDEYRTPVGNEMYQNFNISSVPVGLINRTSYKGTLLLLKGQWAEAVDSMLKQPLPAYLKLHTEYAAETRKATAQVEIEYLQPGRTTDQVALYIVEDSIIGYQKDYRSEMAPSYEHHEYEHTEMLRGSMNATWGTALSPTVAPAAGVKICKRFSYDIPAGWKPQHCRIVAVLHNMANKQVLQVEEKKMTGE